MERRSFTSFKSPQERLADETRALREEAELLPPGPEREAAIRAARQAEVAIHLKDWANSPGLQPPKQDHKGAAPR